MTEMKPKYFPRGTAIYVLKDHETRSGASLYLRAFVVFEGEVLDVTYKLGQFLDADKWKWVGGRRALKIDCTEHGGTDFAYDLVSDVNSVLYKEPNQLYHVWL